MSEITLFGASASPFVKKVQRALAMKKVEYDQVAPTGPNDFKKWSPVTRKMPVLTIRGEAIYDSTFILDRLERDYPEPPLVSRDPSARAGQLLLEDWADESLYWQIMALRWSDKNTAATLAGIASGMPPLVRPIGKPMVKRMLTGQVRAQGAGRLPIDVVVRELGRNLDNLVDLLGERPFFFADDPSRADLAVFGELEMGTEGPSPEVNTLVAERPKLVTYMERVRAATGG